MTHQNNLTLVDEIEVAAEAAISELFKTHNESFYYCSLITDGEAHAPILIAWSKESLAKYENDPIKFQYLKWSYADSPYFDYGAQYFARVKEMFELRPQLNSQMTEGEWSTEFDARLAAMELAMKRLSDKGVFGLGQQRNSIVVNVEVMPPDYENTERALRLNPAEALLDWLREAAEDITLP